MNKKQLLLLLSLYDKNTYAHVYRVAQYSNQIGKQLSLSIKEMNLLLYASLLHDIGKICIPSNLLYKIDKLTSQEFYLIKKHVEFGISILPDSMQEVKDIIAYHHERLDGSGYPYHLKDDQIPKLAKIIAIADSFDAMVSTRLYNKVKTEEEAINDLFSNTSYYGKNKYSYTYVKVFSNCIKKINIK